MTSERQLNFLEVEGLELTDVEHSVAVGSEDQHIGAKTELRDVSLLISYAHSRVGDLLGSGVKVVMRISELGVVVSSPSKESSACSQDHDAVLGSLDVSNLVVVGFQEIGDSFIFHGITGRNLIFCTVYMSSAPHKHLLVFGSCNREFVTSRNMSDYFVLERAHLGRYLDIFDISLGKTVNQPCMVFFDISG